MLGIDGELRKLLRAQMRRWQAEMAELWGSDPLWQKLDQALRCIKGVADRTVVWGMGLRMTASGRWQGNSVAVP